MLYITMVTEPALIQHWYVRTTTASVVQAGGVVGRGEPHDTNGASFKLADQRLLIGCFQQDNTQLHQTLIISNWILEHDVHTHRSQAS